jgi:hypothetical protein
LTYIQTERGRFLGRIRCPQRVQRRAEDAITRRDDPGASSRKVSGVSCNDSASESTKSFSRCPGLYFDAGAPDAKFRGTVVSKRSFVT